MYAILYGMVGLLVIALVLRVPRAIAPKATWWRFDAWKYNNPEANEPSDEAYFWMSIESMYSIAVLSFFIFMMLRYG
jgi:hypothetical protein